MRTAMVRLLGPVGVLAAGEEREVPGVRRKAVLALLGLHLGDVVSTDRLIDVVWDGAQPATVANTLQRNVSYLRTVLGDRAAIVARPPGYLLAGAPAGVDVDAGRAERLLAAAARETDPAARLRLLDEAVSLWRGPSLQDVAHLPGLAVHVRRLEELRLRAVQERVDARLAMGDHERLTPELTRLAAEHPFDERLHHRLMLALYRTGRPAEALAVGRRLRAELSAELGVEPGPELGELETAMLRHDPDLDGSGAPAVRPAQLPIALAGFAGRGTELAALDALLDEAATGSTASVVTVVGGAGVGKTSLAVHWAHRVAVRFPDGQLYANLRGFDPSGPPTGPAETVRGFLDALGVPAARMPAGLDEQTALFRSIVAGKRFLVVLDNARDPAQVRPLLPGAPGCLVVVTSRDQLTGLITAEGARPLSLDVLTPAESHELLSRRLGAARVAAEPVAVEEIIACCARLPLALGIAAAQAALRPGLRLASLAGQLRGADRLDVLEAGDDATDVRHVFSWSYRALTPGAARLFRLLGVAPGPEVGAGLAASLTGLPRRESLALLAELHRSGLLGERSPRRYAPHDLLRAYAAELARDEPGGRDARARVLDYCLHTGQLASRLLHGTWCDLPLPPPAPGSAPEPLADSAAAGTWFDTELPVLLAAVRDAADGFEERCWQLAWTLNLLLQSRARYAEDTADQQIALAAAERAGDRAGQAYAAQNLGRARARQGRPAEAVALLERALAHFTGLGDPAGQGSVRIGLGFAAHFRGDNAEALEQARTALDLFRAAGHLSGQALALNNAGWSLTELGRYEEAVEVCEQSLALRRRLGELHPLAGSWDTLGFVHDRLGRYDRAIECYRAGLVLYRRAGDRCEQAITLSRLGDAQAAAGDQAGAVQSWEEALTLLDGLDDVTAAAVRDRLRVSAPIDTPARPDPAAR
jgi:DNA-binding SARP family transcriptional activator/tetratricopeptide (TPR) repeat protein